MGSLWLRTEITLALEASRDSAREQASGTVGTSAPAESRPERSAVESNWALWATSTSPPRKSKSSLATSANAGAPFTSSAVMPWMETLISAKCSRPGGGVHSQDREAVSWPSRKRTAPIWQIEPQLSLAVSTSTAVKSRPGMVAAEEGASPRCAAEMARATACGSWCGAKAIVPAAPKSRAPKPVGVGSLTRTVSMDSSGISCVAGAPRLVASRVRWSTSLSAVTSMSAPCAGNDTRGLSLGIENGRFNLTQNQR